MSLGQCRNSNRPKHTTLPEANKEPLALHPECLGDEIVRQEQGTGPELPQVNIHCLPLFAAGGLFIDPAVEDTHSSLSSPHAAEELIGTNQVENASGAKQKRCHTRRHHCPDPENTSRQP